MKKVYLFCTEKSNLLFKLISHDTKQWKKIEQKQKSFYFLKRNLSKDVQIMNKEALATTNLTENVTTFVRYIAKKACIFIFC